MPATTFVRSSGHPRPRCALIPSTQHSTRSSHSRLGVSEALPSLALGQCILGSPLLACRLPLKAHIRSKLVCTYLPFLVQGLGLGVVYNEIIRLSFLLVIVWFLVLHMHPASIVYVVNIELQAGR
jgi:hypothetical protein